MLSYDALSEGVSADELLEQVLAAVPEPDAHRLLREAPTAVRAGWTQGGPRHPLRDRAPARSLSR